MNELCDIFLYASEGEKLYINRLLKAGECFLYLYINNIYENKNSYYYFEFLIYYTGFW